MKAELQLQSHHRTHTKSSNWQREGILSLDEGLRRALHRLRGEQEEQVSRGLWKENERETRLDPGRDCFNTGEEERFTCGGRHTVPFSYSQKDERQASHKRLKASFLAVRRRTVIHLAPLRPPAPRRRNVSAGPQRHLQPPQYGVAATKPPSMDPCECFLSTALTTNSRETTWIRLLASSLSLLYVNGFLRDLEIFWLEFQLSSVDSLVAELGRPGQILHD